MILLLADENFPLASVRFLKNKGYDIKAIGGELSSIKDESVIHIAIKENRVIITHDRDFGELVYKLGYKPKGVIYFRWKEFKPEEPGRFLHDLFSNQIKFEGFFTVISENHIRQRKIEFLKD